MRNGCDVHTSHSVEQLAAIDHRLSTTLSAEWIQKLYPKDESMEARNKRLASTASLCVCMLTHSYLLISVFPYAGFLAITQIESVNEENAGRYAGMIASSFMIGRSITSVLWGQVADTYGRTTVLHISLLLSCLFSLLFGVAPSFASAVAIRFLLGCSNGIKSSLKTIVSELSEGDEKSETEIMSIVIGMWGFGFLISPAISGALADPIAQYPETKWLQEGMLGRILTRHPFLLPNLFGAILCGISSIFVSVFIHETLPKQLRRDTGRIPGDLCRRLRICKTDRYQALPLLKELESCEDKDYPEQSTANGENSEQTPTMTMIWRRKDTRRLLCIYWAYSFVGWTADEVFPLFCISHQAGFGLPEKEIGKVLSLCGLIFIASQYPLYSWAYGRFGLLGSVRLGSMLAAPTMILTPIALLLNKGASIGTLNWGAMLFLGCTVSMYRVFAFVFFTSISVMTNRTVPASQRATMNGLSNLGGSAADGVGPLFAGFLTSGSVSLLGSSASLLIFGVIGCLGLGVASLTFVLLREDTYQALYGDESRLENEDAIPVMELSAVGYKTSETQEDAESRE
jgi:MFS family permease